MRRAIAEMLIRFGMVVAFEVWTVATLQPERHTTTGENSRVSSNRKIDLDNAVWLFITQVRGQDSLVWLDRPSDKQVCFRSKAASSQSRLDLMDSDGLFCDTDCVGKRDRARELDFRLVSTVAVHVISIIRSGKESLSNREEDTNANFRKFFARWS